MALIAANAVNEIGAGVRNGLKNQTKSDKIAQKIRLKGYALLKQFLGRIIQAVYCILINLI